MKRTKLKSWIYFLLTASLGGYAIAVSTPSDPILEEVKQLSRDTNAVFLTKAGEEHVAIPKTKMFWDIIHYTGTDNIVDFKSPQYQDLLKKFAVVKADLEKASEDRQLEDLGKGKLANMASASKQFFEQQRRLYNNFYRNLHVKGQGTLTESGAIDKLDLRLMSSTALSLLFNDGNYQARFNLWHTRDNADKIEYGFAPQDKNLMEEKAIGEVPTEAHYAELVQFMVIRERLTNQWGLDRLVGKGADPAVTSCGNRFHSFRSTQNNSYYGSLWDDDRKDEFNADKTSNYPGLISILKNSTGASDNSIISESDLAALLKSYFNHWDEYRTSAAIVKQMKDLGVDSAVSVGILPEGYFDAAPKQLIDAISKQWESKDAESALQIANLPGDSWDPSMVASRTAAEMFHYQRKYLVDALVNEANGPRQDAKGNALNPRIMYVANHQDEARQVASQMVDTMINGKSAAFQASARSDIQKVLNSSEASKMRSVRQSKRFNDTLDRLEDALTRVGRADFVNSEVTRAMNTYKDTWRKEGRWTTFVGNEDFQLSYIPYSGVVRDSVILYTPDQLGSFFTAKLGYFQSKSWLNKVNTNGVTSVAKSIQKNDTVMDGMKSFFGALSANFQKTVFESKMNLTDVNENNTPMYRILPQVMGDSYKAYLAGLSTLKSQSDRDNAKKLYIEAMSMISLGIPLTGQHNYVAKMGNSDVDIIRSGKVVSSVAFSVTSPSDVESVVDSMQGLNTSSVVPQQPKTTGAFGFNPPAPTQFNLGAGTATQTQTQTVDLKHRVVRTLMDQRLAAQVLKQEMISSNPVLAIRQDATDIDSAKLADQMVNFYTPGAGLNKAQRNAAVHQVLASSQKQLPALLQESCIADPHNYQDEAFQNTFRSAPIYRNMIYSEDKRFKPFDDKIVQGMKSDWEKIKDASEPYLTVIGIILLIASIYFFGPIILAGFGWGSLAGGGAAAAGGSAIGTFFAGMGAAYTTTVATATGVQAICASLLVGKASFFLGMIFLAQAVVHTEVNCYELPAQLKYQLKVAQTQIGLYTKESNNDAQIERFATQIHQEKVSTYIMIAMNATTAISAVSETMNGAKELLGLPSAKALARLTTEETLDLVNSVREATWAELVDERGMTAGSAEYISQKFNAITKLGRINTLASSTTANKLREILSGWFVDLLKDDPSILKNLVDARSNHLESEILRVKGLIKTNYVDDLDASGEAVSMTGTFSSWVKNTVAKHTLRFTKYGRILIKEKAFKSVKMGDFLAGKTTSEKQAALVLFSYVQDLEAELKSNQNIGNLFDLLKDSGELKGEDLLKRLFASFGDSDWARMEGLFAWNLSEIDKPLLANVKPAWFSQTRNMVKIQQAFTDYRTLEGEFQVTERYWSSNANAFFSSQQQQGSASEVGTIVSTIKTGDVEDPSEGYVELFLPAAVQP